jgi:hypothetical protein
MATLTFLSGSICYDCPSRSPCRIMVGPAHPLRSIASKPAPRKSRSPATAGRAEQYSMQASVDLFHHQIVERLSNKPEFVAAGITNGLPANESMAKQCWPGQEAVGKRMHVGSPQNAKPWGTIVGSDNDQACSLPIEGVEAKKLLF